MQNTGVIDRFLDLFGRYIDSGFGLIGGDVGFLASALIVIDVTLAFLFWTWGGDEDIIARLVKKTLQVGFFASLISNWNALAKIIYLSFSGIGLKAAGSAPWRAVCVIEAEKRVAAPVGPAPTGVTWRPAVTL